jgi:glycosidase
LIDPRLGADRSRCGDRKDDPRHRPAKWGAFGGDLARTADLLAHLQDLGVNAIEVMPLSNVGAPVDWGHLPIGYFGVDERFGKRSDFQALVDTAGGLEIPAVFVLVIVLVFGLRVTTSSTASVSTRTRSVA